MTILLAALLAILAPHEQRVADVVSRSYGLTEEQTALLCAIRRAENGRAALACGVADGRCRSFAKQMKWTANTIRLRYHGDLLAFAKRWCPRDAYNWTKNVRWFMRKQGVTR